MDPKGLPVDVKSGIAAESIVILRISFLLMKAEWTWNRLVEDIAQRNDVVCIRCSEIASQKCASIERNPTARTLHDREETAVES